MVQQIALHRWRWPLAGLLAVLLAGCTTTELVLDPPDTSAPRRLITQGPATRIVIDNINPCQNPVPGMNLRRAAVGEITATDGTVITVPAATSFPKRPDAIAADLYNECNRVTPLNTAAVQAATAPVVEIDRDGEVVTGYIVADNYYELWVNGQLVAVDATPFTPFNSSIVKFKVKRPYTMAFLLVDWEEHLGLGMERNPLPPNPRSQPYYPGDGGLIARFSDGTLTDATWKAQSFYIAPLMNPQEVVEKGNVHDTGAIGGRVHPFARRPDCQDKCFAVHYPIPQGWQSPRFNDSLWPRAWEFTNEEIGVRSLPGFTRYPELFGDARWIWSYNLVLDNVVIARKTVR